MTDRTTNKNHTWRTNLGRNMIIAFALSTLHLDHGCYSACIPAIKEKTPDKSPNQLRWNQKKVKVCTTPGCKDAAAAIINNMDKSIDPCDDFYEFACGDFMKQTLIDDDKVSQSMWESTGKSLRNKIQTVVTEPIQPDELKPFKMVKLFYKSCIDMEKIKNQGLAPIKKILKSLGGWPVLDGDEWRDNDFSWTESVYKLKNTGYKMSHFIDFSVESDLTNTKKRIIHFQKMGRKINDFKSKKEKHAYTNNVVDIAVLLGADQQRARTELNELFEFEKDLEKILRNVSNEKTSMKIADLQQNFPSIRWKNYLNKLMNPLTVRKNDLIVINSPEHLSKLENFLRSTPKRVQANYLIWKAVATFVIDMTEELRNIDLVYGNGLSGRSERQIRCIEKLSSGSLVQAIGSMYVRRFFDRAAKINVLKIVNDIKNEMYRTLKTNDWMDDQTRKKAMDKLNSMANHIAYPDELLDDEKLNEFYKDLEINDNDFYTVVLNLTKFTDNINSSNLERTDDGSDWIRHSKTMVMRAFYSTSENSINIPAGIMQGPFFSNDRPQYMNYGAIGFVIGHEVTHAFGIKGSKFDKDGKPVNWWVKKTKNRFDDKSKCFVEQYGNYTAQEVDLRLDGNKTLNENLADNGGAKISYYAYNAWTKRNDIEPRLPGLQDYSPQQIFWLSMANVACSKHQPKYLRSQIKNKIYSPPRFRVNGPLSNMRDFNVDFNCPLGSNMNPVNKCQLW